MITVLVLKMSLHLFSHYFPQDEQKAAAMAGLSEEGPPEVDTEEVRSW